MILQIYKMAIPLHCFIISSTFQASMRWDLSEDAYLCPDRVPQETPNTVQARLLKSDVPVVDERGQYLIPAHAMIWTGINKNSVLSICFHCPNSPTFYILAIMYFFQFPDWEKKCLIQQCIYSWKANSHWK